MKTVGLLARPDLAEAATVLRELALWLRARGVAVVVEERTAALADGAAPPDVAVAGGEQVAARADALVVLGGDGTLLAAAQLLGQPLGPGGRRELRQPRLPHRDHARRSCIPRSRAS